MYDGVPKIESHGYLWQIRHTEVTPAITGADPISLMAAWYRRGWKHHRDMRRIRSEPSQPTQTVERPAKYKSATSIGAALRQAQAVLVKAIVYGDKMHPPHHTRWGIGGGLPVCPDPDGVGSWGAVVREYEDSETIHA